MLKKSLLSLAIAAGLGLAGCSGTDSTGSIGENGGNPDQRGVDQDLLDLIENPGTYALFDPGNAVLPIPSDFLYSGTTDGTYEISGETDDASQFIDPTTGTTGANYNPVTNALAEMTGASVTAAIDIPFSAGIDASTVIANQTVFLVPLVSEGDPVTDGIANGELAYIDPSYADGSDPTAIANSFGTLASFRAEVIDQQDRDAASVLRISPLEPLDGATRYLVFLTTGIQDLNGDAINPSQAYDLLGGDISTAPTFAPIRDLVQGFESLASGWVATTLTADLADLSLSNENIGLLTDLGVDPTSIVDSDTATAAVSSAAAATPDAVAYSYTFTTGGTTEVLSVMAAPGLADSALKQNHDLDGLTDAQLSGLGLTDEQIAGVNALRNLPAPKAQTVTMKAGAQVLDSDSGFSVFAGKVDLPYYLTTPSFYQDLAAAADETEQLTAANIINAKWTADDTLATDLGNTDLTAPSDNVTRLFPFAKETETRLESPISVYLPAQATDGDLSDVSGIVMYQHGITSNRTASSPFASRMVANGYVVVAISNVLHGLEPDMFVDGDGLIDSDSTGAKFSPLTFTDVDATAIIAVTAESAGVEAADVVTAISTPPADQTEAQQAIAAVYTSVDAAITAVETNGTAALADENVAAAYTGYSTAVLGQYMLNENHFGLTTDDGSTPRAIASSDIGDGGDESGSLYIYPLHFQMNRDNLRQSVMNLLNLGASLNNITVDLDSDGTADIDFGDLNGDGTADDPATDTLRVHFAGHSLGSIIGTTYVSVNNTVGYYNVENNAIMQGAISQLDTGDDTLNTVFRTQLLTDLSTDNVECGQASTFVTDSLQPLEDDANNGIPAGTVATIAASDDVQSLNSLGCGNNALPHISTAVLANGGGQITKLLENSPAFATSILNGLTAADVIHTSSSYETFMGTLQGAIETADPIAFTSNYESALLTGTTGILHLEVQGDTVVPNGADDTSTLPYVYKTAPLDTTGITGYQGFDAPLASTEPLMYFMGLTNTAASVTADGTTPKQLAVRFTEGDHGSFALASIIDDEDADYPGAAVDIEMATQALSFYNFAGTGLTVTDSSVVEQTTDASAE